MFALRIARMVISIAILSLIFANFFYLHSTDTWLAIGGLIILAIAITVLQIYYSSRARRLRNTQNF